MSPSTTRPIVTPILPLMASFTLGCLIHGPAVAEVLENADVRLEVSSETGAIVRIQDRRSDFEFVSDPNTVRLFRLMLPPIGERTRRIRSQQQSATVEQVAADELRIRFGPLQPEQEQYIFGSGEVRFPEAPLDIDATVSLKLEEDHVLARLELENRSREIVTGVIFPFVGGLNVAGDKPARFVLPSVSQRVFNHTVAVFTGQRANRYPAMLATGWLNFENAAGSLGLEARSGPQAQDAYFSLNRGSFHGGSAYEGRYEYPVMGWISYPQLESGNRWRSPDLRLHVHRGDWHQVAAEHREWQRAENHPARNAAWDEHPGFATYRLKDDDNTIRWRYADLEQLAEDAASAGIRRLVVDGWRRVEGPANPAPFGEIADPRLGGENELSAVIARLADRGVDLIFTFHPAVMNVFADAYPTEHLDWAVQSSRGAPQIPVDFLAYTLDYPAQLTGSRYRIEIDPSSKATDFLLNEADRLKNDYGIRHLLLRGVGQRAFLSYVRRSGLAPADAYRAGYAKLLGGLRDRFADGLLMTEGFNDLVNPFADGAYTWSQSHDPGILPYSIPWHPLSHDVEALDYRTANLAFAHGALINLIVDGGTATVVRYARFAEHLKALGALKQATAAYYARGEFRDRQGLAGSPDSEQVIARVFRNDHEAKSGIVVANLHEAHAIVAIQPETARPGATGILYRTSNLSGKRMAIHGGVQVTLTAFECAILTIDD